MKKILLTGSEGFIGSHLLEALVINGFKVKALVQYNSFSNKGWIEYIDKKIFKEIDIVYGDIRDDEYIYNQTKNVDTIINLAALISIPYSYEAYSSYIDTNLKGTLACLNSVKKRSHLEIINTSTSEVYGSALYTPIDEKHPLQAQSPYSASKIAADKMVEAFYNSYNLPVSTLRPFNTFGPRQSIRAVIPTIILQLLDDKKKSISLGALNPTRDLNYVTDTVIGFISALKSKKIYGEVINIGSGYDISIKDLAKELMKIVGISKKIISKNQRLRPKKSEVLRLVCDNSKAKKLINWKSNYSKKDGLIKGLKKTVNWFKEEENQKIYKNFEYMK